MRGGLRGPKRDRGAVRRHEGARGLGPDAPRPVPLLHLRRVRRRRRPRGRHADPGRLRVGVVRRVAGGRAPCAGGQQERGGHHRRALLRDPCPGLPPGSGALQRVRHLALRGRGRVLRRDEVRGGAEGRRGEGPRRRTRDPLHHLGAVGEDDRRRRGRGDPGERRDARRARQVVVLPRAVPRRRPVARLRARRGRPELPHPRDARGGRLRRRRDVPRHAGAEAGDPRLVPSGDLRAPSAAGGQASDGDARRPVGVVAECRSPARGA
mmetsp:Transcript_27119/g.76578  ORF Transcript_27119/g.76578 Transcript_27119/m.76578 type:complete len:266 (-) Transcript_27119:428-1225(-)